MTARQALETEECLVMSGNGLLLCMFDGEAESSPWASEAEMRVGRGGGSLCLACGPWACLSPAGDEGCAPFEGSPCLCPPPSELLHGPPPCLWRLPGILCLLESRPGVSKLQPVGQLQPWPVFVNSFINAQPRACICPSSVMLLRHGGRVSRS